MRTRGDQADGTHAVVHQLPCQLSAGHARISDGEVETVSHRLVAILVIYNVETVTAKDFFQFRCPFAINLNLVAETVFAVAGSAEHFGQCILCRVARAAAQRIQHAGAEDQTEGQSLVTLCQVVIVAAEQLIADAYHANAFAGIAECLRSADEQHVVVGVAGNGRLVGRLERHAQVLAEVHRKVCQIFHNDCIVLCGQFTYRLQFGFRHAYP